jgi:hypothetical protein
MRFIVQRRSDNKYYGGQSSWVQSEHEAEFFYTQSSAEAFCTAQREDDFDVFLRLRTGRIVRSSERNE